MSRKKKSALATLLPNTKNFLDQYWPDRRIIEHGNPKRLAAIFKIAGLQSVNALMDSILKSGTSVINTRLWFQNKDGYIQDSKVNPNIAKSMYTLGKVTVVADSVNYIFPPIDRFMHRIASELGTSLNSLACNVYCSPAGVGTVMHFDNQEVFLLQIKGRKEWKIAPNHNIKFPTQSYFNKTNLKLPDELSLICSKLPSRMPRETETVILKPGSVLFLPRGYWHTSKTIEDSLALTLTFPSVIWIDLLLGEVRKRLLLKEKWRKPGAGVTAKGPLLDSAKLYADDLLLDLITEIKEMIG